MLSTKQQSKCRDCKLTLLQLLPLPLLPLLRPQAHHRGPIPWPSRPQC